MKNNEIDAAIKHLSEADKVLSTIIKNFDRCNLKRRTNYFNSIVESILSQQLSVKAGNTIIKRFEDLFAPYSPELISRLQVGEIKQCGTSRSKAAYIIDLAQQIENGSLNLDELAEANDEEIIKELTKVKGIGKWTAQMYLMFTLGKPDIVANTDLGIKKAVMLNYGLGKMPSEKEVTEIAENNNWSPYSTIACWYLWRSID